MGVSASAFYSDDTTEETLFRRVRPSPEQEQYLREKWVDVADFLKRQFKGHSPSTWLQGSYKYGTLVRPANAREEYDVDLGFYISPNVPLADTIPQCMAFRDSVNKSLRAYAESEDDVKEVVSPKERCERIIFTKQFHLDVPCYELNVPADERHLATRTKGWENSDPKKLYLWFRNAGSEAFRPAIKRCVCYMKTWANLIYSEDQLHSRPSSILLTVLVAECYQGLSKYELELDEDERFALVAERIADRLSQDPAVRNPVDTKENLNRLESRDQAVLDSRLRDLLSASTKALNSDHAYYSALYWSEIFSHFFPLPDAQKSVSLQKFAGLVPIAPEVSIEVTSRLSKQRIGFHMNGVPTVDKNCCLLFRITNPNAVPAGSTVEWTVRNVGSDASEVNDLGSRSSGIEKLTESRRTVYAGKQYMDCVVKRGDVIIAARRVPVTITNRRTSR